MYNYMLLIFAICFIIVKERASSCLYEFIVWLGLLGFLMIT